MSECHSPAATKRYMLALDMPGADVVVCMGIRICETPYGLLTVLQASSRPKRSRLHRTSTRRGGSSSTESVAGAQLPAECSSLQIPR